MKIVFSKNCSTMDPQFGDGSKCFEMILRSAESTRDHRQRSLQNIKNHSAAKDLHRDFLMKKTHFSVGKAHFGCRFLDILLGFGVSKLQNVVSQSSGRVV